MHQEHPWGPVWAGAQKNRSRKGGFTFIELVAIMVILGILGITAAVSLQSGDKLHLRPATERLRADLRYAHQLAMSSQIECGVRFEVNENKYWVYQGDTINTPLTDPITGEDMEVDYNTNDHYRGITLESTSFGNRIYFDFQGRPFDQTNTPLTEQGTIVVNSGARTTTITIEKLTGLVR